jgi:hypothetical protein
MLDTDFFFVSIDIRSTIGKGEPKAEKSYSCAATGKE